MAFTANDVATLAAAIASGTQRVRFADGREITYQSGADLRAAYDLAKLEVAQASASPPRRTTRIVHVRA